MKITIFNKLRKYEVYLYTSIKLNYIRSLTVPQVEELIGIGKEIGVEYSHSGCPKCLLNFVKKLAVPYFDQKNKLDNKKKEDNKNDKD